MRQQYIDILKGFTIIWVLWMHMDMPELLNPAVQMPVFFFLSGCFYHIKGDFIRQVRSDAYHLLLPTLCFMFIAGLLIVATGGELWNGSVIDLVQTCRNGSITWFLIALFCLRAFSYPFEKYGHKSVMLFIACVLYPLGFVWKVYRPELIVPIIPMQEMFMFGIYYVCGACFGKKVLEKVVNGGVQCIISAVLGICYILIVHLLDWDSGSLRYIPWMVYGLFYTLAFIYVGLCISRYGQNIGRTIVPLAYVGRYSIVFYLTHLLLYSYIFKPLAVNKYMAFGLIVLMEFPLIYMFVNYLPWMIGQKRAAGGE